MELNQVVIKQNKDEIEVDGAVAELAEELLKANIPIVSISIDDTGSHIRIMVPAVIELNRLFEILFADDKASLDDLLFMRVFYPTETQGAEWFLMLSPIHKQWETNESFSYTGQPNFPFQFAARLVIPESDYAEVLRRVKEHNK